MNVMQPVSFTVKATVYAFLMALVAASAHAESPREQLKQMVEQLQKSPGDDALREKIIKLGTKLKPAPETPDEARRRMNRGTAAFKDAKSPADFQDAVVEFRAAVAAAPWWGDAYYNLGVALDKQGDDAAAVRELRRALMAAPGSADVKTLLDQAEYRAEKQGREKAAKAIKTQSLVGNWKEFYNGRPQRSGDHASGGGEWVSDMHYRIEARGDEFEVYTVIDSDADLLTPSGEPACPNYMPSACRGYEALYVRMRLDGDLIKGAYVVDGNNFAFSGTLSESEIHWDIGNSIHQTLRRQ